MQSTLKENIFQASHTIKEYVRHTPIDYSPWLSSEGNAKVYIKWDNEQLTGSAKARGAFNKLLSLKKKDPELISRGAIAASTGNHGAACSKAMNILGINGVIYMPDIVDDDKRRLIVENGSTVQVYGQTCSQAESKARAVAEEKGIPYISPSNDWEVIAGQGTLGLEIHQDLPSVDVVFVAVGGGGLIGGTAAYLKAVKPSVQVIGCEPELSPVMSESIKAGEILHMPSGDTLSDNTSGGVEHGSIAFDLCRSLIDDWVQVTEQDIGKAVYDVMDKQHKIIEGAAGVSVASYLKTKQKYEGKTIVIVACGRNISMEKIKRIIKLHS